MKDHEMQKDCERETDETLRALLRQASPVADPWRLAKLRGEILAQAPLSLEVSRGGWMRWRIWALAAGAACAALFLTLSFLPERGTDLTSGTLVASSEKASPSQAAPLKQRYMAVFDDPQEALFEWEDLSGSGTDPLGLVHEEGYGAFF